MQVVHYWVAFQKYVIQSITFARRRRIGVARIASVNQAIKVRLRAWEFMMHAFFKVITSMTNRSEIRGHWETAYHYVFSFLWPAMQNKLLFFIQFSITFNHRYLIQLFQLRLSPEQSGKVEYERERLLGIANKFIHLLANPSSLSRSYSTFPLCSGDNLNWNSCIH
jgi:hypothetical protein